MGVKVREGFGRWLDGLGFSFGRAGRDAAAEIGTMERPEPKTEAEAALWQAMGWGDDEAEDAASVTARHVHQILS